MCFPHAGGSAASYAVFGPLLPPRTELAVVQYPGRGDRFAEPFEDDVRRMAAAVSAELLALEPAPLTLFGHSLGALVAYETALLLQQNDVPLARLAVSASPPPRLAGGGDTHLRDDDELWKIVCGFGGVEPEIAADEDLRGVLLPILRSDVRANELYEPPGDPNALDCPVRCYHGIGDPLIDESQLPEWAEVSTGPFALQRRPGGHFHIYAEPGVLIGDILDAAAPRRAVS
ncbi:pyochelin biosynthesis editing thioesterase PchC [Kribbella sandramycini]